MSAPPTSSPEEPLVAHPPLQPRAADVRVVAATARVFVLRFASNPIMVIRGPLGPLLLLMAFHLVYQVSGQHRVAGYDPMGFLVIGMFGTLVWSSTVWGAGNALQAEAYQGTISAVMVAPQRLSAVICGYGVGSMLFNLPALLVSLAAGLLLEADFEVAHPVAAVLALASLYACCLCIGVGFGGVFILSRQSNALSNFLQGPIYLLAGFFVPRSVLPDWVRPFSDVLPVAHAVEALQRSWLAGQSLSQIAPALAATALTSAVFLLVGVAGLKRLDEVVRRRGTLDLL